MRCVITETGKVQECDPIKNVPGFSGWAIDQLESAQFVPAMMDGKPARITYIFNFRIGNPTAVVPTEVASWQPTVDEETLSRCKAENAARCHEAALVLLGPKGGSASQDRAARILAAACAGGSPGACAFLARHFTGPKLLDALTPPRAGSSATR